MAGWILPHSCDPRSPPTLPGERLHQPFILMVAFILSTTSGVQSPRIVVAHPPSPSHRHAPNPLRLHSHARQHPTPSPFKLPAPPSKLHPNLPRNTPPPPALPTCGPQAWTTHSATLPPAPPMLQAAQRPGCSPPHGAQTAVFESCGPEVDGKLYGRMHGSSDDCHLPFLPPHSALHDPQAELRAQQKPPTPLDPSSPATPPTRLADLHPPPPACSHPPTAPPERLQAVRAAAALR